LSRDGDGFVIGIYGWIRLHVTYHTVGGVANLVSGGGLRDVKRRNQFAHRFQLALFWRPPHVSAVGNERLPLRAK
jgi:hypothetical protein